ncbi:MAG: hypothetical protein RLZZ558_1417 [Planctomycetota bacterium]
MLSQAWSRAAINLIADPDTPDPVCFHGGIALAAAAAALTPSDPSGWYVLMELADGAKEGMPAAGALSSRAMESLDRLAPNPVIRLAREMESVDRLQTSDERLEALQKLLGGVSRERLGGPVVSRLLFEQSLLLRRRGDEDRWVRVLREARLEDPSYPPPAEALAGLAAVSDAPPDQLAEALLDAVLVNPANLPSVVALGRLCLREGLGAEAAGFFGVAETIARRTLRVELVDELLTQRVLALWSANRHAEAAALVMQRRRQVEQKLLDRLLADAPQGQNTTPDVSGRVALPSSLTSVFAALAFSGRLPDASTALTMAMASLDADLAAEGGESERPRILMQKALLEATVGDPSKVPALLEQVNALKEISPEATSRFEGWQVIRAGSGDAEAMQQAIALLQPIAESDAVAAVGLAEAFESLGDKASAAKWLQQAATGQRDSAVGLYASDELRRMLGIMDHPLPPSNEGERIRRVLARVPADYWKLSDPMLLPLTCDLSLEVDGLYGRAMLVVTLNNRSGMDLAISSQGPIDSRAAITMELTAPGRPTIAPRPFVLPIDRDLRIRAGERLRMEVDLRRTPMIDVLRTFVSTGASVVVKCHTNFLVTEDAFEQGFLGTVGETPVTRVAGVDATAGWIETTLSEVRHPDRAGEQVRIAELAEVLAEQSRSLDGDEATVAQLRTDIAAQVRERVIARRRVGLKVDDPTPMDGLDEEVAREVDNDPRVQGRFRVMAPVLDRAQLADAWKVVCDAWTRCDPTWQAWLLMALPDRESAALEPLLSVARASQDPGIRISYMLRWVTSIDDPMLEQCIQAGGLQGLVAGAVRGFLESNARSAAALDQFDAGLSILGGQKEGSSTPGGRPGARTGGAFRPGSVPGGMPSGAGGAASPRR